ncbi:MAG: polysaccharide deacetylase family protein, partial [Planctomycetia bacterium]|nr:polysaccharide deacetylase family protein [Planctomycetia bacterium]
YYHRIADDGASDWTLSFAEFRRQIDWLCQSFDLVSLDEARQLVAGRENRRPCVAVTFDDGYADNCHGAMALLVERRVPCTYFVTTQYVLSGKPFPHDVAMGNSFAPNTIGQLRDMARQGIEIGAHSRTHADLGAIFDFDRLHDEVVVAGSDLEQALGAPVRYFAFPFGLHANLQPVAFQMARERYEAVCSAYGGYNYPGDDPFHLQRFGAEGSLLRLKNWLSVDPVKKLRTRRFDYGLLEQPEQAEALA